MMTTATTTSTETKNSLPGYSIANESSNPLGYYDTDFPRSKPIRIRVTDFSPSWTKPSSPGELTVAHPPTRPTVTESACWEEMVSKAEERLQAAVDEALDEDGQKPTDAAMVGACDMLDIASDLVLGHNVETYATSSRDIITDVTDVRSNFVVLKNKAGGRVAVHYNINGYKEFSNQGDVDKEFVRSMLSALQSNSATP